VLHLFAALAKKERALISTRTRQALSLAKARRMPSVTLGSMWHARAPWMPRIPKRTRTPLPIIREAQRAGARTLREIAEVLAGGEGGDPNHPYRVSS
jgi:DNA invertase Pin-like site-specific DNA recombinase